jgi:hypothetical protein
MMIPSGLSFDAMPLRPTPAKPASALGCVYGRSGRVVREAVAA